MELGVRDAAVRRRVFDVLFEPEGRRQEVDRRARVGVAQRRKDIGSDLRAHGVLLGKRGYRQPVEAVLEETYLSAVSTTNPPWSRIRLVTSSVGVTPANARTSRLKWAWS